MITPMIPLIIQSIEDDSDREFMENLFISYQRLMFSEIQAIVIDQWATEDVLQTVLEKLIDKIQLLRTLDSARLINYVISATKNTSLNYLRAKKRLPEFSFDDDFDSAKHHDPGFEYQFLLKESLQGVNDAWKKLDGKSKQVLEMKYILEKSDSEIAMELGILPGSVRMTLTRARNNLKAQMEKAEML